MNTTIKYEMTIDQANIVMEALARMPFGQVASLVNELQKQAQAQLDQMRAEPTVSMPMPNSNT